MFSVSFKCLTQHTARNLLQVHESIRLLLYIQEKKLMGPLGITKIMYFEICKCNKN